MAGKHMNATNGNGRRRQWRFLAILPMDAVLTCLYGESATDIPGLASNVGYGGFCFKTREPLGPVSEVEVRITLPQAFGIMAAHARVIWRDDGRRTYGLGFGRIAQEELDKLDHYLNRTSDSVKIIADRRCSTR